LEFIAREKVKLKGYCQNTFNLEIYIYIKKMIFLKEKTEYIYNKMETFFIFTFFLGKNK
jgi:hypothetical protein